MISANEQLDQYLKIREAAQLWGVSERRVQGLCADGRIPGTIRLGRDWMIPRNAPRPADGRTKSARDAASLPPQTNLPMPRKTPFLYMTDLYSVPGTADQCAEKLAYNPEAQILFEAEVAYSRGQIDKVYSKARYLLKCHTGFYSVISAGMLLALCAIWHGDLEMWRKAKVHIAEASAKDDRDRDLLAFALTCVDSMLYDTTNFPEWFKMGCFEPLHRESLPSARVFYAKYLYAAGYAVVTKQTAMDGVQGLSLMSLLPFTVEPMVSQAIADGSVVAAISVLIATLFLPVLEIYGNSMSTTLDSKDIVVSVKTADLRQGDICCLYYNNHILVKRIIGVPGDVIAMDDDGNVFVNGNLIDEPYLKEKALGECDIEFPFTVPEQTLFVLGDNRATSVDSRNSLIGCISIDEIVGKIVFRIWPLNAFGTV